MEDYLVETRTQAQTRSPNSMHAHMQTYKNIDAIALKIYKLLQTHKHMHVYTNTDVKCNHMYSWTYTLAQTHTRGHPCRHITCTFAHNTHSVHMPTNKHWLYTLDDSMVYGIMLLCKQKQAFVALKRVLIITSGVT